VLNWDNEIGSLEPGKQADLVILDIEHPLGLTAQRVLSDVVYHAGPQHVSGVMVAGRMIFRNGRLLLVDEPAIRAQIHQHYAQH